MMTNNRKVHCLQLADQIRLADYLRTHKVRLKEMCPTFGIVAEQASKELAVEITIANLRSVARAANCEWQERPPTNRSVVERSNNTRIIARAVCEIADALEIKIDQAVYLIAAGRNPQHPGSGLPT